MLKQTLSLSEARFAVEAAHLHSEWLSDDDAMSTGKKLGNLYSTYPELELTVPAEQLAIGVAARGHSGSDPAVAKCAVLISLAICPQSAAVLGLALRFLSRVISSEDLRALFSDWLDVEVSLKDRISLLDYLGEIVSHDDFLELIFLAVDRLDGQPTATALRMGGLMQRWLCNDGLLQDDRGGRDWDRELWLGISVPRCRQIMMAWNATRFVPALGDSSSAIPSLAASVASTMFVAKVQPPKLINLKLERNISGDFSWPEFKIQTGLAYVSAERFKTEYTNLERQNSQIRAVNHPGKYFIFGPYMTLAKGIYQIEFLGTADSCLKIEYFVSGVRGTSPLNLAFGSGVARSQNVSPNILISFDIKCEDVITMVEFKIFVHAAAGQFMFEGVAIKDDKNYDIEYSALH